MEAGTTGLGKMLILAGVMLIVMGLFFLFPDRLSQFRLGRLPGDIRIDRESFRFYFPLRTCIVLSVLISFMWWILSLLTRR